MDANSPLSELLQDLHDAGLLEGSYLDYLPAFEDRGLYTVEDALALPVVEWLDLGLPLDVVNTIREILEGLQRTFGRPLSHAPSSGSTIFLASLQVTFPQRRRVLALATGLCSTPWGWMPSGTRYELPDPSLQAALQS